MKRIILIASILFAAAVSYAANIGQEIVEHRIKWYETLNSVARKYGVTVEDILKFNKIENASDVKSNTVLLIPMGGLKADSEATDFLPADESQDVQDGADTTDVVNSDSLLQAAEVYGMDNPMEVSLILPFGAKDENPSVHYFDFYSGALMALDSARAKGLSISLNVFDNKSGSPETIMQDPSFIRSDLIIGPVQKDELSVFAQYGLEHGIPVVSPMDHTAETLLDGNPYLFQVPASTEIQEKNMIDFLNVTENDRVIVVYDSSLREKEYLDRITTSLDSLGIDYRKVGYGLLNGRTISESLRKELSTDFTYKVIVASEDDAFAPDIVRNMRVLRLFSIPVQLFCNNRVRNFESIDSDSFFELSTHVCTPYYIDYSSDAVKKFVFSYRALYNTEPSPYSFQGYDIFSFFISRLYTSGGVFTNNPDDDAEALMQSNIRFTRKNENCGWQNSATRNIIYNENFTISTVK